MFISIPKVLKTEEGIVNWKKLNLEHYFPLCIGIDISST